MEDSFKVRLDKAFGSLSSSSSSAVTSYSNSLWCLTNDEIEKRKWTRESDASIAAGDDDDEDDDDEGNFPSSVDQFFKDKLADSYNNPNPNPNPNLVDIRNELQGDLKELEDEGKTSSSSRKVVVAGGDEEEDELDVRNSIGMDCTLDYEEEEDAYDKVAVGREKGSDDHLYMSDVTDYTSHINSFCELPSTFGDASRDPRANHLAAKLRLQEDAETARSFNSLHVSEQTQDDVLEQTQVAISVVQTTPEDENRPKSILKRKDDHGEPKIEKRVRFEPTCTSESDSAVGPEASNMITSIESSLVPDYVRHPLRYTHYTFDLSSDMNEESNREAYMDFLNMVKKSKSEPDEVPADLSKPVIFNPKKKTGETKDIKMDDPMQKRSVPSCVAEVSEMEVDDQETLNLKVGNGKRTVRKYRSKPIPDSIENDS